MSAVTLRKNRYIKNKTVGLLLAGALTSLAWLPQANASILWGWGYTGTGIAAQGTLTTNDTPDANGYYQIQGITGTRNGANIVLLQPTGTSIPGNDGYYMDNLITANGALTKPGFGFGMDDGTYVNMFLASWLTPPETIEFFTSPDGNGGYNSTELPVTFSLTQINNVPEPGSLALTALAGLGLLWSRKRSESSKDSHRNKGSKDAADTQTE